MINSFRVGSGKHLKLNLQDREGTTWDAIAFRKGQRAGDAPVGGYINVAYRMELNTWRGSSSLQLVVEDFTSSAAY